MMSLATPLTLAPLAGLALVDSTSFGTLGVPVVLLARGRVHVRALLGYLATIAAFYWLVGVGLVLGAGALQSLLAGVGDNRILAWAQLVVGVGFFAASWLFDGTRAAARRERRAAAGGGPNRRERWTDALVGDAPRPAVVVGVALAAGLVEVASMLPYLGAVGIITQSALTPAGVAAALAAYVGIMIAPALVLLGLRLVVARAVEPLLLRLGAWLSRNSDEILGWVLGIVGFLLAADAAGRLGLVHLLG